MCELHSSEKGMQLLPGRPTAAGRHAVESLVEIVNSSENRICVVFAGDFKRAPGGHGSSSALPATCDASDPEHAAPLCEGLGN